MNERIQELMKQSMVEYQFDIRFSPEKFAELIVAECNEVLRLVPYNSNVEFGDEVIYQDAIKEHFGVE
jgi:NTP pyrophosphatase (non-canonical NTP hydrolase)